MRELLKLKTVHDKLSHLKSFIYDLEICILNVDEIITTQNEGVFLKPINGFIGHYVSLVYVICAINCYKIFNREEKRGFLKLLSQMENCRYDSEFKNLFSDNQNKDDEGKLIKSKGELVKLCNKLKEQINSQAALIKKISDRRTKFYAHSDPDSTNYEKEKLSDLKQLRDLAKSIFCQLDGNLYDNHFMFEINIASIKPVLKDRKFVDEYYRELENLVNKDYH